jgi:hypothetical protein
MIAQNIHSRGGKAIRRQELLDGVMGKLNSAGTLVVDNGD